MTRITNVGLIECGLSTMPSLSDDFNSDNGFRLIKVLYKQQAPGKLLSEQYAGAERVSDMTAIIQDPSIELVIVAAPASTDLALVSQALEAGKQVRIL